MNYGSCPLCKSENVKLTKKIIDIEYFQIRCLDCDCRGSRAMKIETAEMYWRRLYAIEHIAKLVYNT